MGYYHCNNCFCCFNTPKYETPERCPHCNNEHHIHEIQKSMYLEWIQIGKDTMTWKELEQQRRFETLYEFAELIWDGYEKKHIRRG